MLDYNAIKRKYSCVDVARYQLGLQLRQVGADEWRGVSIAPGPHHTDDALSVSSDKWQDFSSHNHGSVLDLVAFVRFGNNDQNAIHEAARFLEPNDYDAGYWQAWSDQRDKLLMNVKAWHEALLTDTRTLEYLHYRRISDDTIEQLMLGVGDITLRINNALTTEKRLVLPYRDECGNTVYYASRSLNWTAHEGSPKYHKTKQNTFLKNTPYGIDSLPRKDSDCDILAITEGMIDAVSLIQEGIPTLCSVGGNFGAKKENDNEAVVIKNARRFRKLITCFDLDENLSGQGFTCHMGKLFLREQLMFYCVPSYGQGNKDVSDYYTAGSNIQELLSTAINGYLFMAQRAFWNKNPMLLSEDTPFKNLSPNEQSRRLGEVRKFIYSLKSFLDEDTLSEVIATLGEYFPKNKIEKFAQPPTEHELLSVLRDSFLEGRHLVHFGSVQHGEYWQFDQQGGYWYSMTDANLQSELSAFFHHEKDNRTITKLSMMIRLMVDRGIMPEFNKSAVAVFLNGTLELNTGKFREHRAEDYTTWCHTFDYDPEATCPRFEAFLREITDNEQSRIDFLTDTLGYVLYSDNRLGKIAILLGDGANGKSTFLKILEALFENSNKRADTQTVTNVQPADLSQPTSRIMLEGSLLNTMADITTNLKGCSAVLKAIVTGDRISGNRKFHDEHSFRSRCKIIVSANRMISTDDETFAMRRRLMFCKFPVCFHGDKADTGLEHKLKAELAGIFNLVYRSYRALLDRERTQGGDQAIRPSIDQAELMSQFRHVTDPTFEFWSEYGDEYIKQYEGDVPKDELYKAFKAFCERNGIPADHRDRFHENLQKLLKERGVIFENKRKREGKDIIRYYKIARTLSSLLHSDEPSDE